MPIFANPGDLVTRAQLNALYGGGIQGGILTPTKHPLVLAFSDPVAGAHYGYTFDGWSQDKTAFYYTGEGNRADQQFVRKNKAILDAANDGEEIHLFIAHGFVDGTNTRTHKYVGEFDLDKELPWRRETQYSTDGDPYSVIVFKLRPMGPSSTTEVDELATQEPAKSTRSVPVSLEHSAADRFLQPASASKTAMRRERKLVEDYASTLPGDPVRLRIDVAGQSAPLFTDLWDPDARELYEAKASATRADVRMAIGQLIDYRRHIAPTTPAVCTILLPEDPGADLRDLVRTAGFDLVYREGPRTYKRVSPSRGL